MRRWQGWSEEVDQEKEEAKDKSEEGRARGGRARRMRPWQGLSVQVCQDHEEAKDKADE